MESVAYMVTYIPDGHTSVWKHAFSGADWHNEPLYSGAQLTELHLRINELERAQFVTGSK